MAGKKYSYESITIRKEGTKVLAVMGDVIGKDGHFYKANDFQLYNYLKDILKIRKRIFLSDAGYSLLDIQEDTLDEAIPLPDNDLPTINQYLQSFALITDESFSIQELEFKQDAIKIMIKDRLILSIFKDVIYYGDMYFKADDTQLHDYLLAMLKR